VPSHALAGRGDFSHEIASQPGADATEAHRAKDAEAQRHPGGGGNPREKPWRESTELGSGLICEESIREGCVGRNQRPRGRSWWGNFTGSWAAHERLAAWAMVFLGRATKALGAGALLGFCFSAARPYKSRFLGEAAVLGLCWR
jgi:hypothetical protein